MVDKPVGMTSMQVVERVRRAAGGVRTGHAGTLDPLASGVLVCCIGRATRLVPHLMNLTKIYEAEVDLSAFTTTDDREGQRTEVPVTQPPSLQQLQQVLAGFIGQIRQRPPAFSAVHIQGRRAYQLARKGRQVQLPWRTVRIDALELLNYAWPILRLRITCGKGTYIRSLARDLGLALGTGGHLASLRRLAVGPFNLSQAVPLDRLNHPLTPADLIQPPDLPLDR